MSNKSIKIQSHAAVIASMGTQLELLLVGDDEKYLAAVVSEIEEELQRLENRLSRFIPTSEVNRINQQASEQPLLIDPEMVAIIRTALCFHQETNGAFDITVAPLLRKWGFYEREFRVVTAEKIDDLLAQTGADRIKLDEASRTIFFKRKALEIDLGGMGKGYALEAILEILKESEISNAFLSFGGSSLYGLGSPPEQSGWPFSFRVSKDKNAQPIAVRLHDIGFSMSANYNRQFVIEGKAYGHIFNPQSGKPAEGLLAAAVIHESPLRAEILSTAFMAMGWEESQVFLDRHRDVKAILSFPFLKSVQTTKFNF